MKNGLITFFNKQTNAQTNFDIVGGFSIEDNLNEMPNNLKLRLITSNTYREEFEINTVAYHEDTDTWWIIKSDTSTYLRTGEYEHEVELVEYFETLSFFHLPDCAFRPNKYSYKKVFERLFHIAKIDIDVEMPTFINASANPEKENKYLSFTNYTLSNAIKTVARILGAIPKLKRVEGQPTLYFLNKNGLEGTVSNGLNATFPVAMEVNSNNADQYTVRTISNIDNAKSLEVAVIPQIGGFSVSTDDQFQIDISKTKVYLPTKVDRIEYVSVSPRVRINHWAGGLSYLIYEGIYLDPTYLKELIVNFSYNSGSVYDTLGSTFINDNLVMPNKDYAKIPLNAPFTNTYDSPFAGLLSLREKADYEFMSTTDKNKTFHYEKGGNVLHIPEDYYGLIPNYVIDTRTLSGVTETIEINFLTANPKNSLFRVACLPIADIKVSYDNQNDGQDEKYFNQGGRVVELKSMSKNIDSFTVESVDGLKVRQAKYTNFENIVPLGKRILDSGKIYVVTQRSIDCIITQDHEYYSVIYNLSGNRSSRAEEIGVNNDVKTFAVDQRDFVRRTQLYKDYLEFSLDGVEPASPVAPYLSKGKTVYIGEDYVGADLGYLMFSKIQYITGVATENTKYFLHTPVSFDMAKSKLIQVDFVDNNIIGTKLEQIGATTDYSQTNITYVGTEVVDGQTITSGQFRDIEMLFLDDEGVRKANNDAIVSSLFSATDNLPYIDAPEIPSAYYTHLDSYDLIKITEDDYEKDLYEIPVFEYQVQANDFYGTNANVVVADDFFKVFKNTSGNGRLIQFNYVVSDTRFTSDNAMSILDNAIDGGLDVLDEQRVLIDDFGSPTYKRHRLYSSFTSVLVNTPNATALQNKNIGIFAIYNAGTLITPIYVKKFLYAFNNYTMASNSTIAMYINNWKI